MPHAGCHHQKKSMDAQGLKPSAIIKMRFLGLTGPARHTAAWRATSATRATERGRAAERAMRSSGSERSNEAEEAPRGEVDGPVRTATSPRGYWEQKTKRTIPELNR